MKSTFFTALLTMVFVVSIKSECPFDFPSGSSCDGFNNFLVEDGGLCEIDVSEKGEKRCSAFANKACKKYIKTVDRACWRSCKDFHSKCCCPPQELIPTVSPQPSLKESASPSNSPSIPPPPTVSPKPSQAVLPSVAPTETPCPFEGFSGLDDCNDYSCGNYSAGNGNNLWRCAREAGKICLKEDFFDPQNPDFVCYGTCTAFFTTCCCTKST